MRGFLLDLNRCTGCHACQLACAIQNDLGVESSWRRIYTYNSRRHPGIATYHLSIGCLHCADPACMRSCPAGAYSRDAGTGAVLLDAALCIGCRYCHWACPFDAPRFSHHAGTMSKCTFCNDRLQQGKDPACAALCPTGALKVTEVDEGERPASVPGFPDTRIGPAARFVPLRSAGHGPALSSTESAPPPPDLLEIESAPPSKVGIESEWSLVFFSVAAALLVAVVAGAAAGAMRIRAADFLAASLGTLAISALHLGKRLRAGRALLNLRTSWLSREVVFYLAFTVLSAVMLLLPEFAPLLAWPAVFAGFGALFCIDQVYESVSGNRWTRLHSARALLTGLFLFGLLSLSGAVAGMAGLIKLVLYAYRQSWFRSKGRALAAAARLLFGFVVPLAVWNVYPEWMLPSVLVAEVIDRCEYYLDLDLIGIRQSSDPQP
jgi:DMSO reductase iron-sulfur subunit